MRKGHYVIVFAKDSKVVSIRWFSRYDDAFKFARHLRKDSHDKLYGMVADEETADKYWHPGLN